MYMYLSTVTPGITENSANWPHRTFRKSRMVGIPVGSVHCTSSRIPSSFPQYWYCTRMRTRMRTPYLLVIACATIRGQVRNAMGFVDEPPEDKKLVVFPRVRQGAGPVAPALAPVQKTAGSAVARMTLLCLRVQPPTD